MSLRENDLENLVYKVFEIDGYKSKMGNDEDIVVLSFSVFDQTAAKDLMDFLERGYSFVLDSDVTDGEQDDGTYRVFVEIERSDDVPEQIVELIAGVENLTGISDFKFRYYKEFKSMPVNLDALREKIPFDSATYHMLVSESNMNNFKNFFNKSFIESVEMWDDVLKIKKQYADTLYFKCIEFGDKTETLEAITESMNFNDFGEVIFLCKYLGDYNVTKYGEKITLENNDKILVVNRIQM